MSVDRWALRCASQVIAAPVNRTSPHTPTMSCKRKLRPRDRADSGRIASEANELTAECQPRAQAPRPEAFAFAWCLLLEAGASDRPEPRKKLDKAFALI